MTISSLMTACVSIYWSRTYFGGNWNNGAYCGPFYSNFNNGASNSNTNIGCRLAIVRNALFWNRGRYQALIGSEWLRIFGVLVQSSQ